MTERRVRYSIEEMDRMRLAIEQGNYWPTDDEKRARGVEDRLRTHLVNGTTPEELEVAAKGFQERRWQEATAKVAHR